jgi:hypothetical protein
MLKDAGISGFRNLRISFSLADDGPRKYQILSVSSEPTVAVCKKSCEKCAFMQK